MLRTASFLFCLLLVATGAFARPSVNATGEALIKKMEREMEAAGRSPLQGGWVGNRGRDSVVFLFMHNVCGMAMNNATLYGVWHTQGRTLHLDLQNGQSLDFSYVVRGDSLVLDNEIRLTRYPLRTQAAGGADRGGIAGFGGAGPLEGVWEMVTPQGRAQFVFTGHDYVYRLNGREIEAGTFVYRNGVISYTITHGASAGRRGEHRAEIQGSTLILRTSDQVLRYRRK